MPIASPIDHVAQVAALIIDSKRKRQELAQRQRESAATTQYRNAQLQRQMEGLTLEKQRNAETAQYHQGMLNKPTDTEVAWNLFQESPGWKSLPDDQKGGVARKFFDARTAAETEAAKPQPSPPKTSYKDVDWFYDENGQFHTVQQERLTGEMKIDGAPAMNIPYGWRPVPKDIKGNPTFDVVTAQIQSKKNSSGPGVASRVMGGIGSVYKRADQAAGGWLLGGQPPGQPQSPGGVPVAKDAQGKIVFRTPDGRYIYSDGSPYIPPQ